MTVTAGLDVGGAHLKVALVEDGRVLAAEQFRCRLWMGLEKLDTALAKARPLLARASRHAITMTGELSDIFPDRTSGVAALVERTAREFGPATRYWMGLRGFGTADDAVAHPADTGSTNFLATATLVARRHPDALLIDFGSTTTDIIPIRSGGPAPHGLTDGDRQATGELVYTGFTRTSVANITNRAPFRGQWVTLQREHLATMADVRRILGTLPEGVDLHATADGRGKSENESCVRFARLLGRDSPDATPAEWRHAAHYVRDEQLRSISDGIALACSFHPPAAAVPVVAAGIGCQEIAAIPALQQHLIVSFGDMIGAGRDVAFAASAYAPAVAVAVLAGSEG